MADKKNYIVTFARPYTFETKEYTQVDLTKLESMTSEDLFEANREMAQTEYITPRPEADARFCCILAGRACGLPAEFFDKLPMKEGIKVRNVVQTFFQDEG